MNVLEWITDLASSLPVELVWALGTAISFAESGLGLGLFFPGETAILIVSAALSSPWSAVVMAALVTIAACAGDHVGYLLGRRFGSRLRSTRLVRRLGVQHWDRSIGLLERQGARAILFTRPVPIVRILTPAAAGVAGATYLRFLAASISGALIWSVLYVGLGYLLRSSLDAVEKYLSSFGWVVGVILALVVAVALVRRSHGRSRREKKGDDAEKSAPTLAELVVDAKRLLGRALGPALTIALTASLIAAILLGFVWVAVIVAAGIVALSFGPSRAAAVSARPAVVTVASVTPAVSVSALAFTGLAPWALAGALALPLLALVALRLSPAAPVDDAAAPRRRRLVADVAVLLILLGVAVPELGSLSGAGTVVLFAAILLAYLDAYRATSRALGPVAERGR